MPHHLPIPLSVQSSYYCRGGMNWGLLSIWRTYLPPSCHIDPEFSTFLGSVKLAVGRRRHRSFRWIIAGLSADLTRTLPGKKSNFVDWCTLFLFRYYSIKLKEVFEWILKRNSWSCEKWKSLLHLVIHRQKIKIYIIILTTFVCKKHPQVTLVFFFTLSI